MKHPVELGGLERLQPVTVLLVGRVEHHDVDAAELRHGVGDDRPGEVLVAHVSREGDPPAAGRLDDRDRGLGILRLLRQVRDRDVRPLAGERDRHGAADAGVAAGDQRAAAAQPVVADVAVFAVVGCRVGPLGESRLILLLRREILGGVLGSRVVHGVGHGLRLRRRNHGGATPRRRQT